MFVKKTITIEKNQSDWAKSNSINLSRFVQKHLIRSMKAGRRKK